MLAMLEACAPATPGATPPEYIDRVRALDRAMINTRQFLAGAAAEPARGAKEGL